MIGETGIWREEWKRFQGITQIIFGCLSIFWNSILIILIITKSPKRVGSYKYLMIYISLFEMFYSALDMIIEPTIHTHGSTFFLFVDTRSGSLSFDTYLVLEAVYCGCFGFSLAIFGVHFIYRYGAIEKKFRHRYLKGFKFIFWLFVPIIYSVWWGSIAYFNMQPNEKMSSYIMKNLLDSYDVIVEKTPYLGPYFYPINEQTGKTEVDVMLFVAIAQMWFMIITSLSSVLYFGIKCYSHISRLVSTSIDASPLTRTLQSQLFKALCLQTAIPCLLMYIPVSVVFTCPILNIDLDFATRFIVITIALYPAIDPLPTMFIIKNYRDAIWECINQIKWFMLPWLKPEKQMKYVSETTTANKRYTGSI